MELEIKDLNNELFEALSKQEQDAIQLYNINPETSCSYNIDGNNKISTISFWSNGLSDVESIEVTSEKRTYRHYEFKTYEEAKTTLIIELRLAIKHA